jgi:AraC-like DNA-binding protein
MPEFNMVYGLWVIAFRSNAVTAPRQKIIPRRFEFYGLSHLLKGSGWYWRPDKRSTPFDEGYGVISSPGTIQDYGSSRGDYIEDAICFTGPLADRFFKCGIISDGIIRIGSGRRLLPIFEFAENPSRDSQLKANFALQKLLIDLYFEAKEESGKDDYPQLTMLLDAIHQDTGRWWTGSDMATFCSLSENQFRVVFSRRVGMSPKQYVDHVKIKRASELLCNTPQPVVRIARILGYRDQYHFSRRFKNLTGMSPSMYRTHYTI